MITRGLDKAARDPGTRNMFLRGTHTIIGNNFNRWAMPGTSVSEIKEGIFEFPSLGRGHGTIREC